MSIHSGVRTHLVVIRAGQFVLASMAVLFAALSVTARVPTPPVDLGTLGGSNSYGQALNDRGRVVGVSNLAGDASYHAFAWTSAGRMIDLGTLGGSFSYASGVNKRGQIIDTSDIAGNAASHAVLWEPGDKRQ